VDIVFKGFHEDVDSFGGFRYPDAPTTWSRLSNNQESDRLFGCSLDTWTGSVVLKCSNRAEDVNAPPDVLAIYDRVSLGDHLKGRGVKRIFVCGLALDYCVLDTALNGADLGLFEQVSVVMDASRAAHIPGLGGFGSGFLSSPAVLKEKMASKAVKVVPAAAVLNNGSSEDGCCGFTCVVM